MAGEESLGYGRQSIDDDDVAAVVAALQSDRLTQGPRVGAFEAALGEACGSPHAVAVANGSAALHAACLALDLGPGSRVLTSANTFLASATMPLACGAEVGFLDVDPATGNLDVGLLARRLGTERVDAVVAVHFAGLPLAMEALLAQKRRHGFRLVEDASHALGARYHADGRWWRPGEHPEVEATTLSFHPVKHVTTAEGGAVLTHDAGFAARVRRIACHGVDPTSDARPFPDSTERPPWFGPMVEPGFNHRLSDLHAALGTSQLAKLPGFVECRRALAARYDTALAEIPGIEPLSGSTETAEHAYHLYVARVAAGRDRDGLMAFLAERGIGTQLHYYPVPHQPWFRAHLGPVDVPHALDHARRSVSLPLYPALTDADHDRVLEALAQWGSR